MTIGRTQKDVGADKNGAPANASTNGHEDHTKHFAAYLRSRNDERVVPNTGIGASEDFVIAMLRSSERQNSTASASSTYAKETLDYADIPETKKTPIEQTVFY